MLYTLQPEYRETALPQKSYRNSIFLYLYSYVATVRGYSRILVRTHYTHILVDVRANVRTFIYEYLHLLVRIIISTNKIAGESGR